MASGEGGGKTSTTQDGKLSSSTALWLASVSGLNITLPTRLAAAPGFASRVCLLSPSEDVEKS